MFDNILSLRLFAIMPVPVGAIANGRFEMDRNSQETLRRIGENDATLTCLLLNHSSFVFDTQDSTFRGAAIRENTHLKTLSVVLGGSGLDL